jgi:Calcineurin-like phosphoesterase
MRRSGLLRPVKVLAAWLLLAALHTTAAAQTPDVRVVAIGDVHGALPEFESILKETGLLDARRGASGGWAGGRAVLVQLGDLVDRGPKTRACLDLVIELERTSLKQKNGKVVALLGNHEVMAMMGDMRYVSPEDYQSFANGQSEKVRQNAYRDYLRFLAERADLTGVAPAQSISSEKWMAEHPPGFFERRDAFGPMGVYGRWLRQHNVAYQSGDVVFVHGGLSPNLTFDDVGDLNGQMQGTLQAFDRGWQSLVKGGIIWQYMTIDEAVLEIQRERAAIPMREVENTKLKDELEKFIGLLTWLVSPDNPTWYRGLAQQPEQILGPSLDAMMARLKIDTIVAGHSVMADFQIHQRFDNRVFLIDTGMLQPVFGGKASALEIQDGHFTAHSIGQPPRALAPPLAAAPSAATGGGAQP